MKSVILIPARMESSRFPGKPLAPINGIPMIIVCAKNAMQTGIKTVVCTNSEDIGSVCKERKVDYIITPDFNTGTDRISWASKQMGCDLIVNLQGDEPLIDTKNIAKFISTCENEYNQNANTIWNGIAPIDQKFAFDPNNVKAIVNHKSNIMYMTRKPVRNSARPDLFPMYLKQLGLYGFSNASLEKFSQTKQQRLELSESIEMMRWLELEKTLKGVQLQCTSISVDTPEDLIEAEGLIKDAN